MADNKNQDPKQNQNIGNNPGQTQNPNQRPDRESATQPGKQFPGENQEPQKDRASTPGREQDDDAAKRQSRQDPLQKNK